MSVKYKIVYLLIAAGLLGGSVGYHLYNEKNPSLAGAKADFSTNSTNLYEYFESDEAKANALYMDKVIEVTGVVEKVVTDEQVCSIYLTTGSLIGYVIAELESCDTATDAHKGMSVTVKGVCTGYLSDVILVRSVID